MFGVVNPAMMARPKGENAAVKPLRVARYVRFAGLCAAAAVLVIAPLDTTLGLFDGLYAEGTAPRTHPLTWACLLLAVLATLRQRALRTPRAVERSLWLGVIAIAAFKPLLAPVVDSMATDLRLGAMGWNTGFAFTLIALGQLLRTSNARLALAFAIAGIFLPGVALNGLMLGNQGFYGQMAAPTAIAIFGLGFANLLSFARHPGFRLILHDSAAGRLVHRHVLLWVGLACAMPALLRMTEIADGSGFALLYTAQMACVLVGILHFGVRFAGLLDNAQRHERELLRDATTDPLTGAATRRAAVSYFVKNGWRQPMGVILLDLDHFKQVNDRHGHAAGDRVLQAVVRGLRDDLRVTDLVARWGGEELLILLPAHNRDILQLRAEALRARIEAATAADPDIPKVTASVGVAIVEPDLEPDLAAALDRADTALYEAKAAGRNRVIIFGEKAARPKLAKAA